MKQFITLLLSIGIIFPMASQTYSISGELKKWHKITISFDGPSSSEEATPNPFADYKLDVTFTNGSRTYSVPGYFAADGNADESSATAGDQWKVHFAPDTIGTWSFVSTFYEGADIAINGLSGTEGILHNVSGGFTIAASDKTGKDLRGRGRLAYVGEHYLRFLEDSTYFYKAGADAPENTLAYEDFDDVPNRGNRRKNWSLHQQDYVASTGADYTWQSGKGTELLGVVDYLSGVGVNAFSFLTFSLAGDDENVFPHLLKVDIPTYNGYGDAAQWNDGVYHDRFDVSRMAQWEHIFEYADLKGMYLHFKTQETENDQKMDGGDTDRERKLYYRELIARFSHHLALNWNTGEENTQTTAQEIAMAEYLYNTDPYKHNIVMHTYPGQYYRYDDLTGAQSEYTGASLQTSNATYNELFGVVDDWVVNSQSAGKKWIVAVDEPGNASIGIDSDPDDRKLVRSKVLWGTMMAGGAGVEYYYGYQSGCGDLECQDHRSRAEKYEDASYAIKFFEEELQDYLPFITNNNELTTNTDDYAMTNGSDAVVVYLPDGGSTAISLDLMSTWALNWFNPRTGIMGSTNESVTDSLFAPDTNDWVALITTTCLPEGTSCDDGNSSTQDDAININCDCVGVSCPAQGSPCDDGNPDTYNDEEDGSCNCVGIGNIDIPGKVEAEDFYTNNGTVVEPCSDIGGGTNLGYINNNDDTVYKIDITNTGLYNIVFRVASNTQGGNISFSMDEISDQVSIVNTGGWQTWTDVVIQKTFSNVGIYDLNLDFLGGSGSLFNLNYIDFVLIDCTVGESCDDNNANTTNDVYNSNCECKGTFPIFTSPLLEAEDALIGSQWTTVSDPLACSSEYMSPPNATSFTNAPETTADLITFNFNVDVEGTYKVYARTYTTNDGDDSFWVRANGGTWQKWNKINAPEYPAGYQWSQVGNWISGDFPVLVTFELSAGVNTVDFAWREPGARLDKIFITNEDISVLNLVRNNTLADDFSLRYTIEEACPLDTIFFDPITDGIPFLMDLPIIEIDKPLVIIGNSNLETLLNGEDIHQILINNSDNLSIHKLKFLNGFADSNGGALINNGTLKLFDIIFEGNFEALVQKALTNNGNLIIEDNGTVEVKE